MPEPVTPSLFLTTFDCPHGACRARSQQVWVDVNGPVEQHGYEPPSLSSPSGAWGSTPYLWRYALCAACSQPSFWRDSEMVWPSEASVPEPREMMPAPARELYLEAGAVLPHSRRAAAALIRAALERLLRSVYEDERGRLDALVGRARSDVSVSLWKMLNVARVVGNGSLHENGTDDLVAMYLNEDDADAVEPYFWTVNAAVEELIERPREAELLFGKIPDGKREAAERAAEQAATRRSEGGLEP